LTFADYPTIETSIPPNNDKILMQNEWIHIFAVNQFSLCKHILAFCWNGIDIKFNINRRPIHRHKRIGCQAAALGIVDNWDVIVFCYFYCVFANARICRVAKKADTAFEVGKSISGWLALHGSIAICRWVS